MKNPLIGLSGPHPWDTSQINNVFIKSFGATYTCPYIDYDWWVNGTSQATWSGPRLYDEVYQLGRSYKMILGFGAIPPDKIESFLPMIMARYPDVWAVAPMLEQQIKVAIETIKTFRRILPNTRLVGPNFYTSYYPEYMDELRDSGAMACLDVLALHEYFACPGRGIAPPQPWGTYDHPSDPVLNYTPMTPNLKGRIEWLKSYIPHTRNVFTDGPKVMYTEYGLYVNDVNDAILAAKISKETDTPFVLSTPNAPAYQPWSLPYGNGVFVKLPDGSYDMSWSAAATAFLKEMEAKIILNTNQKITLSLNPRSKANNPAIVVSPVWSLSNNNVAQLSVNSGGQTATLITTGKTGSVQVSVNADANTGPGVRRLFADFNIFIVNPGETQVISVS